ncbi:MAG TPA: hypothetical protein VH575_12880 [Gemmataceae bacterium]|jgi:hypothetical protein
MRKTVSVAVLLACLSLAVAQQQTTKEDKKKADEAPAPIVVKTSLPRGWKSLGLSDKQKQQVLTTRARFAVRRKTLEEQIKALKDEEMTALEKLLTDAQRQRLKELRAKE